MLRDNQNVKKETEISGNLTFTLSRLKQQKRQFSSNDQSETVVGSMSMGIEHSNFRQTPHKTENSSFILFKFV